MKHAGGLSVRPATRLTPRPARLQTTRSRVSPQTNEKSEIPPREAKTYRSDPESFKLWFAPGMRQVASGLPSAKRTCYRRALGTHSARASSQILEVIRSASLS